MDYNFNVLPSNNTKSISDKDPTDVLDLDFEEKSFETDFNWLI